MTSSCKHQFAIIVNELETFAASTVDSLIISQATTHEAVDELVVT